MFFSTLRAPLFALSAYTAGVLAVPGVPNTNHDLSVAHDFARSGAGDFSIRPSNLNAHVDAGGTPEGLYVNVEDIAITKLSRDLAASHPLHEPIFQSCTPGEKKSLLRALGSSRSYIATAIGYLQTPGPKPAYKRWFGARNAARASTVESVFTDLRSNDYSDFTFVCNCADLDMVIRLDIPGRVARLCTDFWESPVDGEVDSQAIMITVVTARLEQNNPLRLLADGRDPSLALARNNPAAAIRNIDSYLEFIATVANLTINPDDGSE